MTKEINIMKYDIQHLKNMMAQYKSETWPKPS